jgi:hypothetical protein
MGLTAKDLQKLVDRQNKKAYKTIYSLVQQKFEGIYDGLILPHDGELLKVFGTCCIYLRSIAEMLHTIKELQEQGFVESAGTVATALWERASPQNNYHFTRRDGARFLEITPRN